MIRAVPYTSIWFGLFLWVLIGGALLVFTSWYLFQDYLFACDAKSVVGLVEQKYETVSHDRHGDHYTDHLVYRYQVGRMAADSESTVQRDTYDSVSEGSAIPLLYLPEEMTNNRIEMPAEIRVVYWTTIALVVGSLASSIGGAFVLRYYVRQNQLNRFLLASGMQCQGTVTARNFDVYGKNNTVRYYLVFTFRDSQGRERTGRSWYLKKGEENLWHPDSPIQVCFDPNNSERFTVDLKGSPAGPLRS